MSKWFKDQIIVLGIASFDFLTSSLRTYLFPFRLSPWSSRKVYGKVSHGRPNHDCWWLCRILRFCRSRRARATVHPSQLLNPVAGCSLLGSRDMPTNFSNLIALLLISSSWSSQDLVICTRISRLSVFSIRPLRWWLPRWNQLIIVEAAIISGSGKNVSTRPYRRAKLRLHFCSCRGIGQFLDEGMSTKANNPGFVFRIIVRPKRALLDFSRYP